MKLNIYRPTLITEMLLLIIVDAGIINAPYGGRKQSGIGYEHGREGMLEYTNFKHIRTKFTSLDGG